MSEVSNRLGVVGAGTMGAGIAQLGCLAGLDTVLHDPLPEALESGGERVRSGLEKGAERGRWTADEAGAAGERLTLAASLEELSGCELVIEAAPERIELKRELFGRLSEICGEATVLATNTSSILVSSLASAAARPDNVVGMHFFNPPPLMRLLEVIAAEQTGERALALASAVGRGDGQDRDRGPRRPRLPREPLRAALRRRGAAAAPGARGERRADRPHRPPGRRLPDGTVRVDGPRRDRRGLRGGAVVHGAELRRAALEAEHAPGADGGRRPPRPQDEARLVLVRGRPAPARRSRRRAAPAAATAVRWPSPARARWPRGCASGRARQASRCASRPRRPRPGRGRRGAGRWRTCARQRAGRPPIVSLCGPQPGGARAAGRRRLSPAAAGVGRAPGRAHAAPVDASTRPRSGRRDASSPPSGFEREWVEDAPGLVLGRIVCAPRERGAVRDRRGRRLGATTWTPA